MTTNAPKESLIDMSKENITRMRKEVTSTQVSPVFKEMVLTSLQDSIHHLTTSIAKDKETIQRTQSRQEKFFLRQDIREKQCILNEWILFEKEMKRLCN